MPEPSISEMEPRQRRRLLALALLRALLTTTVLVALYYLLPVDEEWRLTSGLRMVLGLALFVAVLIWQIRKVLTSKQPGIRAIEALAVTVPLFLLLFATSYFLMSVHGSGNFSQDHLTRTDTLYLAVTIFSTVGFRRHLRHQPERPSGGDVPDAPRSGNPRRGDQRLRQRGAAGSEAAVRDRRGRAFGLSSRR
jgi:voltage-gated potassium channel